MHHHARKIARIVREFHNRIDAANNDPMTVALGATEFMAAAAHKWLSRKLAPYGLGMEAAYDVAQEYNAVRRAKRLRHKDPARLAYLAMRSESRYWREYWNY